MTVRCKKHKPTITRLVSMAYLKEQDNVQAMWVRRCEWCGQIVGKYVYETIDERRQK